MRQLETEERNRALVTTFYDLVFGQHDVERGIALLSPDYRQHNPHLPDGRDAFAAFFTGYFRENPRASARIARIGTNGDLVFLHVHATRDEHDSGLAIMDIFRVTDGLIREHWDVIQHLSPDVTATTDMF